MGARMIALGLLLALVLPAWAVDVRTYVPEQAWENAPRLVLTQGEVWPEASEPWTIAGQVEQESCITLVHRRCWNPRAELKTSREYGFGLGQITTAYREDGSVRFNKFEELKAQHPSLAAWSWDDRYNVDFQLKAIVEMDRDLLSRVRGAASPFDAWAFALAAYNGGSGGVLQDRRLCANTPGCDQSRWFGNVQHHSAKTRRVNPGYGKSAFEINREYVVNVMTIRRDKYRTFWEGD